MTAKFIPMAGVVSAAALALCVHAGAQAAPVDLTWVGTWSNAPGSGNPTGSGGPGMSTGQRYVIKIRYDDTSTVTNNVDVLNGSFAPSGATMTTISLKDTGNSLDIFVPMEGLDVAGTPFIYVQDESTHFPAYIPEPTLNFVNGSAISNPGNIIGLEFEGNFFAGAGDNFIELFNTSADGATINLVSQILNFSGGTAISGDNSTINNAVAVSVTAGTIVYSAGSLTQTTAITHTDNDLGAARSDGEDFLDATWQQGGSALVGTATGHDIAVAIADSGLTNTTSTATWDVALSEQMTGLTGVDSAIVSYANATPTLNVSSVVQTGGIDFSQTSGDLDLAVNAFIAGFESIVSAVLLDGATDVTAFFADLWSTGSQSASYASLETAFGLGVHTLDFSLTDLFGASATSSLSIDVLPGVNPPPVPAPAPILLLMAGLLGLTLSRRRRS